MATERAHRLVDARQLITPEADRHEPDTELKHSCQQQQYADLKREDRGVNKYQKQLTHTLYPFLQPVPTLRKPPARSSNFLMRPTLSPMYQ